MGFPGTSGASFIDLMVLDRHVAPPEYASHYTEKLILMPGTYFVSDYHTVFRGKNGQKRREDTSLDKPASESESVICNHDSFHKVDAERFRVWMSAAHMSGATLQLLQQNDDAEQRLKATAERDAKHTATAKLVFRERLGVDAHLEKIGACAVAVDTDGIGAHTTAANYLYRGVPVVTRPTEHLVCVCEYIHIRRVCVYVHT
jgi:protein O-GlcNAc transferase